MRSKSYIITLVLALLFLVGSVSLCWSKDYERRFIRNYPPGYYGMWYYAERFYEKADPTKRNPESYRWDRYMSKITDVHFPFLPIPYDWDYGSYRKFNLPDYNSNDWN